MKQTGIKVPNVEIKNGKVKRIHKFAAGQRKAKFAKAAREENKWRGK